LGGPLPQPSVYLYAHTRAIGSIKSVPHMPRRLPGTAKSPHVFVTSSTPTPSAELHLLAPARPHHGQAPCQACRTRSIPIHQSRAQPQKCLRRETAACGGAGGPSTDLNVPRPAHPQAQTPRAHTHQQSSSGAGIREPTATSIITWPPAWQNTVPMPSLLSPRARGPPHTVHREPSRHSSHPQQAAADRPATFHSIRPVVVLIIRRQQATHHHRTWWFCFSPLCSSTFMWGQACSTHRGGGLAPSPTKSQSHHVRSHNGLLLEEINIARIVWTAKTNESAWHMPRFQTQLASQCYCNQRQQLVEPVATCLPAFRQPSTAHHIHAPTRLNGPSRASGVAAITTTATTTSGASTNHQGWQIPY
jgi:hypothetical protein